MALTDQPASDSDGGWLVAATVPKVGFGSSDQILFAAAISDPAEAKLAVQKSLGGLHCQIEARMRMTAKALAHLDVGKGDIKRLSD